MSLPDVEILGSTVNHSLGLMILSIVGIILGIINLVLQKGIPNVAGTIVMILLFVAFIADVFYFGYVLINYFSLEDLNLGSFGDALSSYYNQIKEIFSTASGNLEAVGLTT
jgi:hypothetical protein